ncbi:MAG: sulfatase [Deltaproteobacteria bacterium]|nr:sulfatase [Deltaproteobacteria bacterium]
MRTITTLFTLMALFLPLHARAGEGKPAGEARRLNVILISADTLRGDMLGVNGNREVKTPRLDELASQGVNFRRAYTNITTTTPSHAAMLTSLYPRDHRAYDNQSKISSEIVTLPERLKKAGYHTAGIVNMPWLNPDVTGVTQGIDELARGDHIRKAEKTVPWVLDFLDRRKAKAEEPFFLFVHLTDNHTPYHAPEGHDRLYYPKDKDPKAGLPGSLQKIWPLFPKDHIDNVYVKRWIGDIADADYVVGAYKGSVTWLDRWMGKIFDRLKANGQWEDTLVVFTADHGESLGEHGLWFCHGGLFEPTTRIPLILRIPGGPAGAQVETIVDTVDIVPTVLGRLGLEAPGSLRGEDLWPVIEGKVKAGGAAYLQHTGNQLEGVVTPRYKLVLHRKTRTDIYAAYPIERGRVELYDLEKDPGETKNIAKANPKVVAELTALMKKLRAGGPSFEAGAAKVDADTEEALRALGYVQ